MVATPSYLEILPLSHVTNLMGFFPIPLSSLLKYFNQLVSSQFISCTSWDITLDRLPTCGSLMSTLFAMATMVLLPPEFIDIILCLRMCRRVFIYGFHNLLVQGHYFPPLGSNMVIQTMKCTWFSMP